MSASNGWVHGIRGPFFRAEGPFVYPAQAEGLGPCITLPSQGLKAQSLFGLSYHYVEQTVRPLALSRDGYFSSQAFSLGWVNGRTFGPWFVGTTGQNNTDRTLGLG